MMTTAFIPPRRARHFNYSLARARNTIKSGRVSSPLTLCRVHDIDWGGFGVIQSAGGGVAIATYYTAVLLGIEHLL